MIVEEMRKASPSEVGDDIREYVLGREFFGELLSLSTRAVASAAAEIRTASHAALWRSLDIMREHPGSLFNGERLEALATLLQFDAVLPVNEVASLLVGAVKALLATTSSRAAGFPIHYFEAPRLAALPIRWIVTVGRTIGLGDEALAASAIAARVTAIGGELWVQTAHPSLWTCYDVTTRVGRSPFSAIDWLLASDDSERAMTATLFLDFLDGEPAPVLPELAKGCAASAKWIFGSASGELVDWLASRRFAIGYPAGYPPSRPFETRWMCARLFAGAGEGVYRRRRATPVEGPVLLQCLTAKPNLMLAPAFYRAAFERAVALVGTFRVAVISGPDDTSRTRSRDIFDELALIDGLCVELLPQLSLDAIGSIVARAKALVGVDTFTGHLAALARIPQVTMGLREHRNWRHAGTPSIYVTLQGDLPRVADAFGTRVAWAVSEPQITADSQRALQTLRAQLDALSAILDGALADEGCENPGDAALRLDTIDALTARLRGASDLPTFVRDDDPVESPDLRALRGPDGIRALARWYQAFGSGNLSAAAYLCSS